MKIIIYESRNYSEDFMELHEIVRDDEDIQDIIDTLVDDECYNIRVFELGNEISDKYDTTDILDMEY